MTNEMQIQKKIADKFLDYTIKMDGKLSKISFQKGTLVDDNSAELPYILAADINRLLTDSFPPLDEIVEE